MSRSPADALDANFAVHAAWAARQLAEARVREDAGLLLVDSGRPCDTFNFVLGARLTAAGADAAVADALRFFAATRHPFSWWVGPADTPDDLGARLERAGLERAESEEAMAVELARLVLPTARAAGLEVRRARTPAELADFARVNAANWMPPDAHVVAHYARCAPLLLGEASPLWFYVGYVDGEAVAAAELTVGGGAVGLYGISTLAAHRGRRYGTMLTLQPLLDARAAGHRLGVLQASSDGAGVYRRLGFETFGRVTEFKPPA